MGLQLATVYVNVRGDLSKLPADLNKAKPKLGRQSSAMGSFAGKAFSDAFRLFGVAGVVASFAAIAKAGEGFNRKLRNSMAIMGDLSGAMRTDLRDAALEAASTTQFSAAQTAEAFFFLASAGLDAQQSIAALPQVAKFAQAGMFDMAHATSLAANAQSALGLKVKDAGKNLENLTRVTDVLVKANTLADATTQQFSEAITTKAGGAARIAGKDIEELVATLAVLADQGVKGAEAGTALNIVYRDLQTKSIKNAAAFKRFGVEVFNSAGAMNNMADIIEDLENALDGMGAKQKKQELLQLGFQDRSVVFTQLLIGMSEKMREFEAQVRKAGGTTAEVAAKQLTPLQKGMAKLGAAFTKIGSEFMEWAGPILGRAMSRFSEWFGHIRAGFILLGKFVHSFVTLFIDGFKLGLSSISDLFKPFVGTWNNTLTTMMKNLDVFFGSWEGFRNLVLTGWNQTTTAIASLWQQAFDFIAKLILKMDRKIDETVGKVKTEARVQAVRARQALEAPNIFAGETAEEEAARLMKNANEIGQIRAAANKKENNRLEQHNTALQILSEEHNKKMKEIGEKHLAEALKLQKERDALPKLSDRFRNILKEAMKDVVVPEIKFDELITPKVGAGGLGGGFGAFGDTEKHGTTGFGGLGKMFQDLILENANDEVPKKILEQNVNQVAELQKIDMKLQRSLDMEKQIGLV